MHFGPIVGGILSYWIPITVRSSFMTRLQNLKLCTFYKLHFNPLTKGISGFNVLTWRSLWLPWFWLGAVQDTTWLCVCVMALVLTWLILCALILTWRCLGRPKFWPGAVWGTTDFDLALLEMELCLTWCCLDSTSFDFALSF